MKETIIKIENLSHRYSVQWAVKDVSLEIPSRGICGLLGANGAGKSTMMNILCGVLKATQGNITINDIDIKQDPIAAKKFLGFLPQKPPLFMDLTVEEYLEHSAILRNIPKNEIEDAMLRVMELCSLTHFRKRLIRNLSGGYQQRVGIAQALIHDPQLVVFDEPTNGLDPNQILDIRKLIKDIAQEKTVLLSTHILSEVQAICDQIVMMSEGTVVFNGSVEEFDNYISPNTVFVQFSGYIPAEAVKAIEGVNSLEEIGMNRYRLQSTDTKRLIAAVIKASYEKGWNLLEIREEKSSLDEVFAVLSKKK